MQLHPDLPWQDNPEPPEHYEPTLFDRLEVMPKDVLWAMLLEIHEAYPDSVRGYIEMLADDYEREQLAKIATP